MSTVTFTNQSAATVPVPATGQFKLFVDADSILKTKDDAGVVRPSGVGTATELATTGMPVNVAAAPAPVAGAVLTATAPTTSQWLIPYGGFIQTSVQPGGATYNAAVRDLVRVDPSAGGDITVNLPTVVGNADRRIAVKIVGTAVDTCIITPSGGETIDGAATLVLTLNYEWAILVADGVSGWMQIG